MAILPSVIAVQKWMATVSGSQAIGLHILEKGSTTLGRRTKQPNLSSLHPPFYCM